MPRIGYKNRIINHDSITIQPPSTRLLIENPVCFFSRGRNCWCGFSHDPIEAADSVQRELLETAHAAASSLSSARHRARGLRRGEVAPTVARFGSGRRTMRLRSRSYASAGVAGSRCRRPSASIAISPRTMSLSSRVWAIRSDSGCNPIGSTVVPHPDFRGITTGFEFTHLITTGIESQTGRQKSAWCSIPPPPPIQAALCRPLSPCSRKVGRGTKTPPRCRLRCAPCSASYTLASLK